MRWSSRTMGRTAIKGYQIGQERAKLGDFCFRLARKNIIGGWASFRFGHVQQIQAAFQAQARYLFAFEASPLIDIWCTDSALVSWIIATGNYNLKTATWWCLYAWCLFHNTLLYFCHNCIKRSRLNEGNKTALLERCRRFLVGCVRSLLKRLPMNLEI